MKGRKEAVGLYGDLERRLGGEIIVKLDEDFEDTANGWLREFHWVNRDI